MRRYQAQYPLSTLCHRKEHCTRTCADVLVADCPLGAGTTPVIALSMPFVRTKFIKGIEYHYLVENYREDGKVRQRVLCYLGEFATVAAALDYWRAEVRTAKDAERKQHARRWSQS